MIPTFCIRPERRGWRVTGGERGVNLLYVTEWEAILHPIKNGGDGRRRVVYYTAEGLAWFTEVLEGAAPRVPGFYVPYNGPSEEWVRRHEEDLRRRPPLPRVKPKKRGEQGR